MKPKSKAGKTASKKAMKHPVPEWMSDDIKAGAAKLDPLERIATELRGFSQAPVKLCGEAAIPLRPKFKEAVILFAEHFGGKDETEARKVSLGIRWVLEIALPKMEELKNATDRRTYYERAEGVEQSVLVEQLIGDAIEKWKTARAAGKERADED
jgi:predicted transcriptional regulator